MKNNLSSAVTAVFLTVFSFSINLTAVSAQTKTTSDLWGDNGELWDTRGRLSDFSYAGYGGGNAVKPDFTNIINVLDQGVIANDGLSDADAINAIINTAPDNSVVFFPVGRYVIDKIIEVDRSNILLRGEGDGPSGTIFYLPKSATEVTPPYDRDYSTGRSGHFVSFLGNSSLSTITKVSEEALRSDRVIVVEDASQLNQWDIIVINARGDNPINGELWHEYFNNQSQDWPEPHVTWATGDNVLMTHTIEKIEGNLVTLREPLRLKLKPSWNMLVRKLNGALKNVGIEDIRMDFIEVPKESHLNEPGYNGIRFENCQNFWSKNITIVNCDNGIGIRNSSYGELEGIALEGREGHHGFKIGHSSNILSSNLKFNNNEEYVHSFTIIHKANGNVVRNMSGDNSVNVNTIRLDFHRNAPFSNLWTDVRTPWTYQSSGDQKAGPHGAGYNVYWGLEGDSANGMYWRDPNDWKNRWGQYQGTLVSGIDTSAPYSQELFTEEREWYEDVPNLAEKDLYEIQKRYHSEFIHETVFNSNEYGNRGDWKERDPSRWKVMDIVGNNRYALIARNLPPVTSGKLSEYSVIDVPEENSYEVEARVKRYTTSEIENESDVAIITAFSNDDNYIFGRLSADSNKSGIYRVLNGNVTKLVGTSSTLSTNGYVSLKLVVNNGDIAFVLDNNEIARVNNVSNITFGKAGVGSSRNGVVLLKFSENSVLSIDESTINSFKIYPNPVDDEFVISLKNFTNATITIFNMNGQLLYETIANKESIKIAAKGVFPQGVYIVKISNSEGQSSFKKMIIN
ncbi:T9SS type A sorting domain-containing protein [uncultured Algibacter sp.]|uniref:T9SS type A sorting domain-containing protein n=1 Tax=uncultured Algibacter sp. TaxID=298659 RepID=UPI0026229ED6|nr:T9SS type A sorting domain-containing protein [uncultured Algibacter sp.]